MTGTMHPLLCRTEIKKKKKRDQRAEQILEPHVVSEDGHRMPIFLQEVTPLFQLDY